MTLSFCFRNYSENLLGFCSKRFMKLSESPLQSTLVPPAPSRSISTLYAIVQFNLLLLRPSELHLRPGSLLAELWRYLTLLFCSNFRLSESKGRSSVLSFTSVVWSSCFETFCVGCVYFDICMWNPQAVLKNLPRPWLFSKSVVKSPGTFRTALRWLRTTEVLPYLLFCNHDTRNLCLKRRHNMTRPSTPTSTVAHFFWVMTVCKSTCIKKRKNVA